MIEHRLSPEHDQVARQASERIRAAITGSPVVPAAPPPESDVDSEDVS